MKIMKGRGAKDVKNQNGNAEWWDLEIAPYERWATQKIMIEWHNDTPF